VVEPELAPSQNEEEVSAAPVEEQECEGGGSDEEWEK
jgi:hypothetical protein